jgi:hypothetical protein
LRRRLYRLSGQLFFHPYWGKRRPSPNEWWALRELERSRRN